MKYSKYKINQLKEKYQQQEDSKEKLETGREILYFQIEKLQEKKAEFNTTYALYNDIYRLAKSYGDSLIMARIYRYEALIFSYGIEDNKKALRLINKSLRYAKKANSAYDYAVSSLNKGYLLMRLEIPEKVLETNLKALQFAKKIDDNEETKPRILFKLYSNIGNGYREMGEYGKSIDFFNNAYIVSKDLDDNFRGGVLSNIGNVYLNRSDFHKAIEYYLKALELKNKPDTIPTYINMGDAYLGLNKFNKSIQNYEKSHNLVKKLKDKRYLGFILLGYAKVYIEKEDFAKAEKYVTDSICSFLELKDMGNKLKAEIVLFKCFFLQNKTNEFNELSSRIEKHISSSINNRLILDFLTIKIKYYELSNNFKSAYYLLKQYHDIDKQFLKSFFSTEMIQYDVERLTEKYENEQEKRQQLENTLINSRIISIKTRKGFRSIKLKDLLYAEKGINENSLKYTLNNDEEIIEYSSIKKFMNEHANKNSFLMQCNKSCVVNLLNAVRLEKSFDKKRYIVIFKTEKEEYKIDASIRKSKHVYDKFQKLIR